VLNQFCEFGNHLGHYEVTGRALGARVRTRAYRRAGRDLRLAAFTSATGSAGTIAAGDRLKEEYGTKIVAVEALECPTMLENGFGEHNIQGIGDKHIPLIHNVMNTDVVVAVSDHATDELVRAMFNSERRSGLPGRPARACAPAVDRHARALRACRPSATCSPRSSTAKLLGLGPDDAIVTVATDGGCAVPERVRAKITARDGSAASSPAPSTRHRCWGEHLANVTTAQSMIELHRTRAQPHLQPRLLHVGRAAGHTVRAVRGSPPPGRSGRGCAAYLPARGTT
jgi:cysteine synthase A